MSLYDEHYQRIEDGARDVFNLGNLSRWIETKTKLNDLPYSFVDHEYQRDIIDDPENTIWVAKCAQVGLSEIFARWAMAACATQDNFTLIWTFPNSTDAEKFCKARLDPFIQSSDALRMSVSPKINSIELKQFGKNSFCYIRGTQSETGALSVPADLLIHDEYDRSDMNNISAYISRLQHKPTKMRRVFSTPTVKKYGIDAACDNSRRWRQMWKCSHCNHHFLPDYEQHVVIPGWNKPKKEITKSTIKDVRWKEAYLACPNCGLKPSPLLQYREWVWENNSQISYPDKSYFITPWCLQTGPFALTPAYLVKASTDFDKWSEFVNQALGLTAEDDEESLTETDIRTSLLQGDFSSTDVHYMGVDMGMMCTITIAKTSSNGELVVVYREKVSSSKFEQRRMELCKQYRVICSVHDAFPYTDTIQKITGYDTNAYGAVYADLNNTVPFQIKEEEEQYEEGKLNMRRAQINRSVALDELMNAFKKKKIVVNKQEDAEEWVDQMRDMKRVQKFDRYGGIVYRWVKTRGEDHWHHSLLYAYVASKLRGTYTRQEESVPSLVHIVKVKANQSARSLIKLNG